MSCSKETELPKGVSLRIAPSNEVILTLEKDVAIMVKTPGKDGRMVLVVNIEGVLSVTQLEKGGSTPVSVEFLTPDKAKITIERGDLPSLIVDEDGDGLPDIRIDKKGKYRVKNIEWEVVKEWDTDKKNAGQDGGGERDE